MVPCGLLRFRGGRISYPAVLTIGIDEVGYGPRLGPLVVAAAGAFGPLRAGVRIADSKKIFSQARGRRSLEPAVLGFVPAATFEDLIGMLGERLPDAPWYRATLAMPSLPRAGRLDVALVRFVEPSEFNEAVRTRNKSDFLFDITAYLINRIRDMHRGPVRFLIGKQGGRRFYLGGLRRLVSPEIVAVEEARAQSVYEMPGVGISFMRDAEDRHELVALASMIGKYVRECAMELFNGYWMSHVGGLRPTAGYGRDGMRFFREIEPFLARLRVAHSSILRNC